MPSEKSELSKKERYAVAYEEMMKNQEEDDAKLSEEVGEEDCKSTHENPQS